METVYFFTLQAPVTTTLVPYCPHQSNALLKNWVPADSVLAERRDAASQLVTIRVNFRRDLLGNRLSAEAREPEKDQACYVMPEPHDKRAKVLVRGDDNPALRRRNPEQIRIRYAWRFLGDLTHIQPEIA